MKPYEVQRSIEQSMKTGAARILDRSRVFDPDPRKHAEVLTQHAVAAQRGNDAAWEHVVDGMSRLVFRTAETYFWKWHSHLAAHASFDDVFMQGMEGLTIGVNKFDASTGNMLTTYATPWIRTRVQRACYVQCGAARIPEELLQAGVSPLDPLVASATKSLDWRGEDDNHSLGDTIPAAEVEAKIHELESVRRVVELLRTVDERMPQVAELLERGYADREVGRIVGVPAKQVGELRAQAAQVLARAGLGPS